MAIFYILFFIIVILLLLPTILISLVTSILSLFGFRKNRNFKGYERTGQNTTARDNYNASVKKDNRDRKKIFDKNEGEYVDFEEIK